MLAKNSTNYSSVLDNPESASNTPIIEKTYHNELFQNSDYGSKPWWKANFFISEPIRFGTWDGVFTSCVIHLFGIITLMRAGWIVGNAGIILSIAIVITSLSVAIVAVISGIRISERLGVGTIHTCLSQVLGARLGGAISIAFSVGQCVNCALHITGFSESLSILLQKSDPWFQHVIGFGLIIALLLINIAGVEWVIRLQYFIITVLLLALTDFAVGLFSKRAPESGVIGYNLNNLMLNIRPQWSNAFAALGVFFPAVTGVFAGINMSTDLYNPKKSVPIGTFSAIAVAFCIYLLFMVGLGLVCSHESLTTDSMIAVKVSVFGYFVICALYISSMSSSLGSIYTTPRIIFDMANERIVPGSSFLAYSKGPNKVPINAMILYALLTAIFALIRNINVLATIVTIPYLLTFAFIEYAHFSLCMTFDMRSAIDDKFGSISTPTSPSFHINKGSEHVGSYGSLQQGESDLFKSNSGQIRKKIFVRRKQSSSDQSDSLQDNCHDKDPDGNVATVSDRSEDDSASHCWLYNILANRYLAAFAALLKITLMFLVNWVYALAVLALVIILWFYIGYVNPGVYPGASKFVLATWIRLLVMRCFRKKSSDYQQYVITFHLNPEVLASQITHLGKDFSARERYHQTSNVERLPSPDFKK